MKTENLHCDFCKKVTTNAGKKLEALHGFSISLGYSLGGWGKRQNFTPERSYEICADCFGKTEEKSVALARTIAGLSGHYTIDSNL